MARVDRSLLVPSGLPSLLFFVAVLIVSFLAPAHAQIADDSTSQATPAPADGHAYLQMLSESVNPVDGSVIFRVDVPIPKGRGLTLPFAWVYNSAVPFLQASSPGKMTWGYNWSGQYRAGAWTTNIPLLSDVLIQYTAPPVQDPTTCYATTNFVFTDPLGGTHPLGLSTVLNPTAKSCTGVSWASQASGGDDYVMATGASTLPPSVDNGNFSVVDSQGTVYSWEGTWGVSTSNSGAEGPPWKIEDRNGNVIYLNGVPGPTSITDSSGRTALSFSGGSSGLFGTVTVSGMSTPYSVTTSGVSASGVSVGASLQVGSTTECFGIGNFTAAATMPTAIKLPNGQQYTFAYDPAYGLISQITYPTGGYIKYVWEINAQSTVVGFANTVGYVNGCVYTYGRPAIAKRYVSFDGKTNALEQDFSYTTSGINNLAWTGKTTTVVTKDLIAGATSTTVYTYGYVTPPAIPNTNSPTVNNPVPQQIPVDLQITYEDGSGNVKKTIQKGWVNGGLGYGDEFPSELTTLDDGSISSVCYRWGPGHTITDRQEWDYGSGVSSSTPCPTSGSPTRETKTVYQSFAPTPIYLSAPSILDRPASVSTYGNGTLEAQTLYSYDQSSVAAVSNLPSGTHDEINYGSSLTGPRGNATTVTRECLTCTNAVTTYTFDETGQTLSIVDPNGNATGGTPSQHTTTYSYTDSYTDTHPTTDTNTYLTQITYPPTSGINHIESFSYAYSDGQLTVSTDENSLQTTYTYNDSLRRLTGIAYPDGGQVSESYNDTAPAPSVTTSKKINTSQTLTTVAVMDGVGHVTEAQVTSDPQGTIYKDTAYNGMNLVSTASNPYRKGTDPTTSSGTTTYSYDALSRKTQESYPGGSILTTAYCGPRTLVTDPTGRWRRSRSDSLGRVVEVDEPNAVGATVLSTGCPQASDPIWVTSYTYDALNDLTQVLQNASRQRTFTFDSLKRLLTSSNPEAGQITYSYDPNSNVLAKKDARSITTTNTYDFLNRLTTTTFSNGDPTVSITYDQSSCLVLTSCANIGHRTSMTDGAGSESWAYQVDPANLRDVHRESRTIDSSPSNITKTTTYYFDLASNLTSIVYPTSRTINYTYDNASRPISGIDSSNGITYVTAPQSLLTGCLSGAVCYTPQGSVYSESIGQSSSFTGLNLSETYNSRLQPGELKASSSAGNAMDITYNFVDPVSGKNAGHVNGITNNLASSRSQVFTYDQLNRVISAGTTATTGTYCWGYQYSYDAWGNLLSQAGWTPNYSACTENVMGSVTASAMNQISGLTYDASGNTLTDGNYTYTWNAESEIKTAAGVTYSYDGDGRRVAKVGSKLYWYGSGGEVLAETDASGNTQNEYVFFGGKRVAVLPASGTPLYYEEDFLGSSRVIVQSNGTLCYDGDFVPFGGERAYTNTCSQNYKFEGNERDTETQNDDFGAREYSWRFGRWLSSDWSAVPTPVPYANLANPQTLNLYAMVADDPESFADLDGHGAPFPGMLSWNGGLTACLMITAYDTCATRTDIGIANGTSEAAAEASAQQGTQQSGGQAQNKSSCGFWCKVGQAFGFVETDAEKKAAAGQRDWINRNVTTQKDGKPPDTSHMSDRQVTNYYNMIMMGLMMGRIPIAGSSGPGAPNYQTDPAQSPGEGWEWRGKGPAGSSEGSWYNAGTNESFHPDLSHPDPIGPHYDYRDALGNDYRVFPDGTVVPK